MLMICWFSALGVFSLTSFDQECCKTHLVTFPALNNPLFSQQNHENISIFCDENKKKPCKIYWSSLHLVNHTLFNFLLEISLILGFSTFWKFFFSSYWKIMSLLVLMKTFDLECLILEIYSVNYFTSSLWKTQFAFHSYIFWRSIKTIHMELNRW